MPRIPKSTITREFARCFIIAVIGILTSGLALKEDWPLLGGFGAALATLYVVVLLFFAAYRSDVKNKSLKPDSTTADDQEWSSDALDWAFPTRTSGIIIVFELLAMIVAGFAAMYRHANVVVHGEKLTDVSEALYFSFSTFSTLGHWNYQLSGSLAHFLVAAEVLCGMLLLVFLIALLIARLSDW